MKMAERFDVSMPSGEKKLINWIRNQMQNNEISPSLVFRDAMIKKKAEWDAMHSENPVNLHKRIDDLKQTVGMQSAFIGAKKERQEAWFNFFEKNGNNNLKQKQKGGITETFGKTTEILEQKVGEMP